MLGAGVFAILVVASLITATISGFLGMAGGVTLLGVMTALIPARLVIPLHGVVQLASNLTRTFAFRKHVRWPIFLAFLMPSGAGVWIATQLYSDDKLVMFQAWIGVFILFFLVWRRYQPKLRNLPFWSYGVLGLVVGFLGIFVGATSPFLAPFFLRDDFENEEVIATKAVCQMWIHTLKIPAFLSLAFDYTPHLPLLATLVVAVVAGTYTGKHLLKKISKERFVLVFQVVLTVLAFYLIYSSISLSL